jgi:aldehyde:ferredoxin oxidoreductase
MPPLGFMGKILELDLTTGRHQVRELTQDLADRWLGGTGLGAYLEDASFWKLRELSMSYTIPERYLGRANVRSASLRLTARNLGIWSDFKSWDPEIATQGNDAAVYNFVQLSPPRVYTLRMTLGF